eukprot:TRINITY_DN3091_c0_g2_i1.p1 TRINITY_DN3091_c0_g2~~TRINITY_DN3091_c0_g2_i1.p1  ORF type:complete len:892 (+),score=311.21 TRINITY_DN3091_c0_g2_i1:103-2778(+)
MKEGFLFAFFQVLFLFIGIASSDSSTWNPVADPKAIVLFDVARFTVLTENLIRMENKGSNNGFEDRATLSFVNRRLPVPKFVSTKIEGGIMIKTSKLVLTYTGGNFNSSNLRISFNAGGVVGNWTYGQTDSDNLLGTIRTLDGDRGTGSLVCSTRGPDDFCTNGVISRAGWVVVDDTQRIPLVPNQKWGHWASADRNVDSSDLYFFGYGRNYRKALKEFTLIGGNVPLPPRYVFGVWFSRYWAYSDIESREIVNEYEGHNVPLDVLVTDMDWHITFYKEASQGKKDQAGETPGWTGYTWDKNLFPNSSDFLAWCKKKGLRNTLNLHPASGVQPHEERYPQMAKAFGIDPASKKYVPFNITDTYFTEKLFDIMLNPVSKQGIDFWWLDWQQWQNTAIKGLNPTIWLNHVFFNNYKREGMVERPTVFHRWGGLGNHRYQIGFSGDVVPSWNSLTFQPYFTATASNVGYSFWSHDLGGHTQASPPELYTRWTQWGLFSPVFRPHCTKNADNDRRIWVYPLVNFLIMKDVINLRSSLVPHIYTLARNTHDSGVGSIVTPLYYDYPQYDQSYKYKSHFAWGSNGIIAPVTAPVSETSGLTSWPIFLPSGSRYLNWFTGQFHDARAKNVEFLGNYTLPEIPAFFKAGSIVSYWPTQQKALLGSAFNAPNVLGLNFFVDGSAGSSYDLYEDAGNDQKYLNGESSWTKIDFTETSTSYRVVVNPPRGSYTGMASNYNYEFKFLNSWPASSVQVNGNNVAYNANNKQGQSNGWRYDGDEVALIVNVASHLRSKPLVLTVTVPAYDTRVFDGVRGLIKRSKDAKQDLDYAWGQGTIYQSDYSKLVQLSEIGSVLSANPTSAAQVLGGFKDLVKGAADQLKQINYGDSKRAVKARGQILNIA